MAMLPYISDEDFLFQTNRLLQAAISGEERVERNPYRNVVDPFSALIDASRQKIPLSEWMRQEKSRQVQKSFQNALGDFHQGILGSLNGWKDLETNNIADVRNDSKKIIAEVKNKYNTTKGNHKREIYDDLATMLSTTHHGYVGYYVEVVPKSSQPYDKPFTPSDNRTHERRPSRDDIRVADGFTFYGKATGYNDALALLYEALPRAIARVMNLNPNLLEKDPEFIELFEKVYPHTKLK